jgi:hypothetical protein
VGASKRRAFVLRPPETSSRSSSRGRAFRLGTRLALPRTRAGVGDTRDWVSRSFDSRTVRTMPGVAHGGRGAQDSTVGASRRARRSTSRRIIGRPIAGRKRSSMHLARQIACGPTSGHPESLRRRAPVRARWPRSVRLAIALYHLDRGGPDRLARSRRNPSRDENISVGVASRPAAHAADTRTRVALLAGFWITNSVLLPTHDLDPGVVSLPTAAAEADFVPRARPRACSR